MTIEPRTMPEGWRPPVGMGWEIVPRKLWPQVWTVMNFPNGSPEFRVAARKIRDWKRDQDHGDRRRRIKARRQRAKLSRRRNRR